MAIARNRLVPALGIVILVIVVVILMVQCSRGTGHVKAGAPMSKPPGVAAEKEKEADRDTPQETLRTLTARVDSLIAENKAFKAELDKRGTAPPATSTALSPATSPATASQAGPGAPAAVPGQGGQDGQQAVPGSQSGTIRPGEQVVDTFGKAMNNASGMIDTLSASPGRPGKPGKPGNGAAAATGASVASGNADAQGLEGEAGYQVLAPMGYAAWSSPGKSGGPASTRYLRTSGPDATGLAGSATTAAQTAQAAQAAQTSAADSGKPVPYFTIPENATLVGVTGMTSLIGRVPVDGRVTDPMQFKAVVGRENLAANGFDLPDDIAGMIVTGVAIGDMALSCSEGKIQSLTFVFNDGAIRTVSSRRGGSGGGAGGDLGFISDLHGNPCIQGKFVTNAPAFLADLTAMKTLTAAGQAYADAQRTVSQTPLGGSNSTLTGNMGSYALGQAVSGASDEVSRWLLQRMKNSFDAVVTPSGQPLVVHLDQEIRLDKDPRGRKLVHRSQGTAPLTGARYGLE